MTRAVGLLTVVLVQLFGTRFGSVTASNASTIIILDSDVPAAFGGEVHIDSEVRFRRVCVQN